MHSCGLGVSLNLRPFFKWHESIPEDILVGSDSSTSGFESNYVTPYENNRRSHIGHDKAKKMKREDDSPKAKQPSCFDQQSVMLEKGVEQLNKQTEMFLKQHNEGMNRFFNWRQWYMLF